VNDRRRNQVPLIAAGVALFLFVATMVFVALRSRSEYETLAGSIGELRLVSPQGEAGSRPLMFVWRSVRPGSRYTLEILTPAGDEVFRVEVLDTALALPSTAPLIPGNTYRWWVWARTPDGQEARSEPASFTP
jgi:hypothetical protein